MSLIRDKIIEIGVGEATPTPYGKVSDMVRDKDGNRTGWPILKSYFDEAVHGWTERHWQGRGKILPQGGSWKEITYLQGVQVPTYRVPQPSKDSGVSWCGIFATWVLKKAGIHDAKWMVGAGIVSERVKRQAGNEGFQPGDVIVIRGGEVHQAIVKSLPDIYEGDGSIETINGNSDNQSLFIRAFTRKTSGITTRY